MFPVACSLFPTKRLFDANPKYMSDIYRLSQAYLNLLETCPPQFQKVYLEQLNNPADPEQLARQEWGSQFHLILQQRELGLPLEALLKDNEQLSNCFHALLKAAPEITENVDQLYREAEHYRSLAIGNYLLTAIYDLIILESDRALIFDWKTYLKPVQASQLANNWQTRLYLYILAETSNYPLESLSMVYWFVQLPHAPEQITFRYNQQLHERTRQDLTRLLSNLDQYLLAYQTNSIAFPHRQDCPQHCPYYQSPNSDNNLDNLTIPSIEQIAEINPFI
jgi:hypothetical protein